VLSFTNLNELKLSALYFLDRNACPNPKYSIMASNIKRGYSPEQFFMQGPIPSQKPSSSNASYIA
jgi:hypothetical protein